MPVIRKSGRIEGQKARCLRRIENIDKQEQMEGVDSYLRLEGSDAE